LFLREVGSLMVMAAVLPTILGTSEVVNPSLKPSAGIKAGQSQNCMTRLGNSADSTLNCSIHRRRCLAFEALLATKPANDLDSTASTSTRCSISSVDSSLDSIAGGVDEEKPRYYKEKVESWFHAIDTRGNGYVHIRQFMAALRRVPGLQEMLCKVTGVKFDEGEQRAHAKLKLAGLLAIPAQERSVLLLEERRRIKDVFHAFGTDASEGMLNMSMFLKVFYQRGLILKLQH